MGSRLLFISWGQVVRGREEHAVDVFNDGVGLYGRMQQEGRIERFDVALFGAHAGINGYMVLHGSHAQLDAVEEDGEFRDITTAAALVVADLDITEGVTDAGIAVEMERYEAQTARVG